MTRVAIVDGIRTPFAKAGSALKSFPAQELGRIAVRELLERTELDPKSVDEVILGNVSPPSEAPNLGRVVALTSGIPESVPAHTVSRNCASGMQAIAEGFELIHSGRAHTIVAGGTESMSNIPIQYPEDMADYLGGMYRARTPVKKATQMFRFRPRMLKPVFALERGLTDPFCGLNMGQTAEVLAKEFHISRKEQDEFALQSHRKAVAATESGRLGEETVPIYFATEESPVTQDQGPRAQQTLEALAKLPPYFDRRHGTVTVGNSCPVTDGAAALLLMSEARVRMLGAKPLAWIRSTAFAGLDPRRMGLGPSVAAPIALRLAGLTMREIGLVEINEAFAAQVLANLRVFERPKLGESVGANAPELSAIDPGKLNVNGGAIALGHPVGTSGARITLTLAREMKHRDVSFGLAALCVGGGLGGALILERAT